MGNPLAMTLMRRSSTMDKLWMWRSASRVLVVTRAPPSLQMRAAALSRGPRRLSNFVEQHSVKHWSVRRSEMPWKLSQDTAHLPFDRWLARIFPPAPLYPHEGPMVQGCCTGQPPGTHCFYTGQSPRRAFGIRPDLPLPGWKAICWHGEASLGKEMAEGWNISSRLWWAGRSSNNKLATAASVRNGDQRETRAELVAAFLYGPADHLRGNHLRGNHFLWTQQA